MSRKKLIKNLCVSPKIACHKNDAAVVSFILTGGK